MPADFDIPILVVQHFTPDFLPGFVRWLDEGSALSVQIARSGQPLQKGHVYVAPDNRQLGVSGAGRVRLEEDQSDQQFCPSGSWLFEKVARVYEAATVAVILTGMGDDGVAGLKAVRDVGGYVIGQDQATSAVYGMPRAAKEAGLVDVELPIEDIAAHLVRLSGKRAARRAEEDESRPPQ